MAVTEPIDVSPVESTDQPVLAEPGVQIEKLEHIEDALDILPDQGEWERLCIMARTLALATSAPDAVRNKPADMLLVLLTGRDLGIKLTEAVRTVQVVEGKISLAPRLKIALIESKGLGWIKPCVVDPRLGACPVCGDPTGNTTEKATAHAWRAADDTMASYVFTIEDAKRAKIIKDRGAWTTYPQRMLWWRASGYLADDLFPNAAIGIYSPDELGGMTDEDGAYIDVSTIDPADGFGRAKPPEADLASEDDHAEMKRRVRALPDEARHVFGALWAEKLPPPAELLARQMVTARALIASVEKRATAGEWGDWSPPEPATDEPSPQPEADEKPADAPESAPDGPDAPTLLDVPQEPQGATRPPADHYEVAIAHLASIEKRQVVLELGSHGLATTGNEQSMRKRLALFYAEHPDQLPKGEG